MKTEISLRRARIVLALLLAVNLTVFSSPSQAAGDAAASMQDYCSVPPLPGFGVKPNLLLLIDNSSSMYDLAYTDPATFCLDDSFSAQASYPGYFDQGALYLYAPATDINGKEAGSFVVASGSTIDASPCNGAKTGDVCVNLNGSRKVDNFLASGKFLNWLAMSKLDIEKLALTGGKYDTATGLLKAESRGCQGKRFVKMIGAANLTFALRGPIPAESDYVLQGSHGGATRIEVYAAPFKKEECLKAVKAWQDGASVIDLTSAASSCMGASYEEDGVTPTKGRLFTEIMSYCYSYLAGADILFQDIQPTLIADCKTRYMNLYNDDPYKVVKGTGDDICGRGVFHNLIIRGAVSTSTGYLGQCYSGFWDQVCAVTQTKDFCADIQKPWLTDPSAAANQSVTKASLPSFILDAGITSLGEVSGTMLVRFAPGAAPKGLVQQFGNDINFGAMIFNDNGAGSECGGDIPCVKHCQNANDPLPHKECYQNKDCDNGKKNSGGCKDDTRNDGGRIISYLNKSSIGDHTPGSGLVASIDAIRATSWTPLAESFYQAIGYFANRNDFMLQGTDFDIAFPPSQFSCQRNNILVVTDGMSTADRSPRVTNFVETAVREWADMPVSQTTTGGTAVSADPPSQGSYNLDDLAWIARNRNIFDPAKAVAAPRDYISTHVVYTGPPCGDPKSTSTPKTGYNLDGTCATGDEGVPEKMMQLAASKGGGSISSVQDPAGVEGALKKVFQQIRAGSNSGTSSSILSTGDGNGALFLQAQFYPNKSFDGGATSAAWIGEMQGLWYFIDHFISTNGQGSTIREDTGGGRTLDLKKDRVVQFNLDSASNESRAQLYLDTDGDGTLDRPQPTGYPLTVAPEAVQSLWRAGLQLWKKDPAQRTIYTQTDGRSLIPFLDTSREENRQLLLAADAADAEQIVSFVKGTDDTNGTAGVRTRDRGVNADGSGSRVWKLGDIISSTPALQSGVSLGSYHLTGSAGYSDLSYAKFIDTDAYRKKRGTVYVGANDGMLHAFRLGSLKTRPDNPSDNWPQDRKAALLGTELGEEEWAFIPKNALPYLRYLREPLYPHLYYVDGSSTLADVSLGDPARCSRDSYWDCPKDTAAGSNWRTVLIGGMGLGGASRQADHLCLDQGDLATCVKAPPQQTGGLSSYFALDVTGQTNDGKGAAPRLLWEFSHPELGFATSGAAILRIKARSGNPVIHDPGKNGRWFAVFASGPTGPINRSFRQFLARSDQQLKLFVVDLNANPPLTEGVNYWVIDTGINNAFGGSIAGGGIDTDKWDAGKAARGHYEDDALYLGYTRLADDNVSWTGGVLRLMTGEDPNPGTWSTSKVVDGIGPVTGGVAKLQDRQYKRLWLYFGAGRFFHNQDDLTASRALFGISEPCYTKQDVLADDKICSAKVLSLSDLTNVTLSAASIDTSAQTDSAFKGWWIGLDAAAGALGSERVTATPSALTGGAAFFTTFKPEVDACAEGKSYLWGVKYNTGGAVTSLNGMALVPLSNGSSAEFLLSGLTDKGGRRSEAITGKAGKPKFITNSGLKPLKKIIHIQER